MDENERKYLEEKIGGLERLAEQRFEHVESTAKAFFNEMGRRLEEHNKFREQILNERGNFLTKEMFEARHRETSLGLKAVEDFVNNLKGRIWSIGVGAAIGTALLSTVVSLVIKYL